MWGEILKLVWMLVVIVAVLALSYLFTRYVAGRTANPGRSSIEHMEVLEKFPLGREQRIVLVRMGEVHCFLGVTPNQITCLREIPQEEWERLKAQSPKESSGGQQMGFGQALQTVLDQRRKQKRGE